MRRTWEKNDTLITAKGDISPPHLDLEEIQMLEGRVVTLGHSQTGAIFRNAKAVLKSSEVGRVFCLPPAPGAEGPLGGVLRGDGAYLIEEITRVLQPATTGSISQERLLVIQRIAYYGQLTIVGILDDSPGWDADDRTDAVIQSAYSRATVLRDLGTGAPVSSVGPGT